MMLADRRAWRRLLASLFAERRLYIRSKGRLHRVVLTTRLQALAACGAVALALWTGLCTAAALALGLAGRASASAPSPADTAVAQMVRSTEQRHAALALVLDQAKGQPGAGQALAPAPVSALARRTPAAAVQAVRADQDRLLTQAESFAKVRADRLRLALRPTGVNPAAVNQNPRGGVGGPLIEVADPKAVAASLHVDLAFAQRICAAAKALSESRRLQSAADALPLAKPTLTASQPGSYGLRTDPFTGRIAFHPGLDFPGAMRTPIYATAPGVVSFAGFKSGYGNTVEIDHGGGVMTRFGHLSSIGVRVGQQVAAGQRIAAMGSTGRSTGPHLHYEVWSGGRPQNPEHFLEAGAHVQKADQ